MFTLFFQYVIYISAICSPIAALTYVRSMFKGKAKPNRMTWLMWTAAPWISVAAELANGVRLAALPVFMAGFSPFLIFTSSFFIKGAYWKLRRLDYAFGILSALALVLWALTRDPNVAIAFSILSDGLAAVPMVRKAWMHPETETIAPFIFGITGSIGAVGVAKILVFSYYAFPVYLICINSLIIFTIMHKVIRLGRRKGRK